MTQSRGGAGPRPCGGPPRLAAGAVAGAYGLGALAVAHGPGERTTYAGASELAAALTTVAGLALVAAGVATSLARQGRRVSDLAPLAGFLWFAPVWAGWNGGPALARSLGTLAAVFRLPVLLHLVVAFPSGVLRSPGARALVIAVYLEAAHSALGRALFRDPFFDPSCWDDCTDNVFVVRSLPDSPEQDPWQHGGKTVADRVSSLRTRA